MVTNPKPRAAWDIFCRVVDNYGDAGVCWRIAQLLNHKHGLAVRLWIDRPEILRKLQPALGPQALTQHVDGVEVCDWSRIAPLPDDVAVVIEAFGCGLPDAYAEAMASGTRPPVWIILDYLSAESWVDSHHGLASPHPRLPLQRWYFFPGFTPATGGLPCEADLLARRDAFDAAARKRFWRSMGFAPPSAEALTLSMFAYADAPLGGLFEILADGDRLTTMAVPEAAELPVVNRFFGKSAMQGNTWCRGSLEVRVLPFLPQARYDELLWICDLNFVRGEDSFVRAQWAAQPLVWQPYRQDSGAHQRKLKAFLDRYLIDLPPPAAQALQTFTVCWNEEAGEGLGAAWQALRASRGELATHARRWADDLSALGEMSTQLVEFVRGRVK